MDLKICSYRVNKIESGESTSWEEGVFYINLKELRERILKDENFSDVQIELVRPGETTRIIHALDAIEPRVKVEGPSCCFPGFMGPAKTAGSGVTNCLPGVAVLGVGLGIDVPTGAETGVLEFNEGFIDMSGPAQKYCTCGNTFNVCLCLKMREGRNQIEFDISSRMATIKAADYLARATIGKKASEERTFSLFEPDPDLPRIAYINQIQSQGFLCRTFLYSAPMEGYFTPTLLHPNELLDGAIVSSNFRSPLKACTYLQQNNQIVLELLNRHGKDVNFVGQIVGRGHFDDFLMKERQGQYAAKLASLLKAEAVVLTIEGAGNANIDYMATVKALEQSGICAVPIVHEMGGGPKADEQPLVDVVPEAVSIISGGGVDQLVEVPAMTKVVGGESIRFADGDLAFKDLDASSGFTASAHLFYCGFWQMQISGIRAVDY